MNIEDLVTFEIDGKKCIAMVRKLTERECFRLMGVSEQDIDTIQATGISRTNQYRLAGNSIVVDVLFHIFRKAFIPSERGNTNDLFGYGGSCEVYDDKNPLRVATLCSGYDSQFMALDRLEKEFPPFRYKRVWFAEHDPESKKPDDEQPAVIAHKALYPDCPNLGDITKIDWQAAKDKYGDIDLLFYSTPCQSISQAGLQHGFTEGSGTRSSIIWNVRDALDILRPKYACLENVAAMVSAKFLPMYDLWRDTVASFGYANYSRKLNAKDYGVPQNRDRIFLFSVNKDKVEDISYFFPEPLDRKVMAEDVLEKDVDARYYLNPIKVQEFVKNNLIKIKGYAEEGKAKGMTIDPLPEKLRDFI